MFHNATPEATKPAPVKTVNELSKSSVELTEAKFKRYNLRWKKRRKRRKRNLEWKRSAGLPLDLLALMPRFDHPVSAKETSKNIMTLAFCGLRLELNKAQCMAQCMIQIWYISDTFWYLIEQRPGALVLLRLGFGDRTWLYVTGDSTCIYLHDLHHQETQTIAQTAAWEVNMPPKGKVTETFLDFGTKQWPPFNRGLWLTICAWVCMRSHGSPFKPRENFKSHLPSFNSVFKQLKHWSHLTLLACENCIATF